MLQHVPVAWENAHPVVDVAEVDGAPDALFKTFFGGHTAYAALLACDKLGLSPPHLLFRPRAAFERAARDFPNLSIEGRRAGLDGALQGAVRFVVHERRRQMLFVQLYSVRRALIETACVGQLWLQRQRLVTGREPAPLPPPPMPQPLQPASPQAESAPTLTIGGASGDASAIGRRRGPGGAGAGSDGSPSGGGSSKVGDTSSLGGASATTSARGRVTKVVAPPPPQPQPTDALMLSGDRWEEQLQLLQVTGSTRLPASLDDRRHKPEPAVATPVATTSTPAVGSSNGPAPPTASATANGAAVAHAPFPPVPDPAAMFRWRTPDVLDQEEKLLSETCGQLTRFGAAFLRAEQSRLHEQLSSAGATGGGSSATTTTTGPRIDGRIRPTVHASAGRSLASAFGSRPSTSGSALSDTGGGGRPAAPRGSAPSPSTTTAGGLPSPPGAAPLTTASPVRAYRAPRPDVARVGSDTSSDSGDDATPMTKEELRRFFALGTLSRPSTVGGRPVTSGGLSAATAPTVAKPSQSHLWLLGESPFSVAGTRPPRPPSERQPLTTRHGRVIGDDYVSTCVARHLRVIARQASQKIVSTIELTARDEEFRRDMEEFHSQRVAKVPAVFIGAGFDETASGEPTVAQETRAVLDERGEQLAQYRYDKMRERHDKQARRLAAISERKLVTAALSREAELVRREGVRHNRQRADHVEMARRLVVAASREGRHERVEMLQEQHRAAAWNSRVSHVMEAMVRAQMRDRVNAMQLTRRWELDELFSPDEISEIFRSDAVVDDWSRGIRAGIEAQQQRPPSQQPGARATPSAAAPAAPAAAASQPSTAATAALGASLPRAETATGTLPAIQRSVSGATSTLTPNASASLTQPQRSVIGDDISAASLRSGSEVTKPFVHPAQQQQLALQEQRRASTAQAHIGRPLPAPTPR
jgi:hypothetical protein